MLCYPVALYIGMYSEGVHILATFAAPKKFWRQIVMENSLYPSIYPISLCVQVSTASIDRCCWLFIGYEKTDCTRNMWQETVRHTCTIHTDWVEYLVWKKLFLFPLEMLPLSQTTLTLAATKLYYRRAPDWQLELIIAWVPTPRCSLHQGVESVNSLV